MSICSKIQKYEQESVEYYNLTIPELWTVHLRNTWYLSIFCSLLHGLFAFEMQAITRANGKEREASSFSLSPSFACSGLHFSERYENEAETGVSSNSNSYKKIVSCIVPLDTSLSSWMGHLHILGSWGNKNADVTGFAEGNRGPVVQNRIKLTQD